LLQFLVPDPVKRLFRLRAGLSNECHTSLIGLDLQRYPLRLAFVN
jgi:hypothetical protein